MLVGWFGRKLVIFFKVRLCIFAFRNQKDGQKIFAAQTPQRKRGFFSTHQTIVGKTFPHLRSFKSSLADAPHCSMGLVSMHKLVDIILALMPCHVTVCVNFILGAKSNFLKLLRSQQDTLLRPARCREMTTAEC